ncbi:MAG TPA: hypothetical protein VGN72_05175 [Tepidisphaeraceae bacterium]|jgi:hypothetical protein|nr:hypothetical protein [Tepidisphaeraceae bacterium]
MAKDGASDANELDETENQNLAEAIAPDELDAADVEATDEDDEIDESDESEESDEDDATDDDEAEEADQALAEDEEDEEADDRATLTAADVDATPWASIETDDAPQASTDASEIAKPLIAAPEALLTPAVNFQSGQSVEDSTDDAEATADEEELAAAEATASHAGGIERFPSLSDPQIEPASVMKVAQAPAIAVVPAAVASRGGWWTIPTLCGGLAIVACSLIIPQTDANRRLAWEREMLDRDFESVTRQVEVNEQFLRHIARDPNMAERLAQRQLNQYRQGTAVLDLKRSTKDEMSPFLLTAVVPPEPLPPYQSRSGRLAQIFLHPRHGLFASGLGLLLIATGLIMGGTPVKGRGNA